MRIKVVPQTHKKGGAYNNAETSGAGQHIEGERVRMAERQNDTVVKSTRCNTLARRVTLAHRQNDTVRHFGTEGHFGTATKC